MKYHQIAEGWRDKRQTKDIALEVEDENGDVDEIPAEIAFTVVPYRAASHTDPAEGGVEDVGIIINGKEYDSTEALRAIGVVSYDGDFDKIIDAHVEDLHPEEPDEDGYRYRRRY